jgi:tricarballylate dehydrogenase
MRTAYLGPAWSTVKVRGTRYDTGELTRAAFELGAASAGQWSGCHATPIDADAPEYGELRLTDKTNRLSYPYCVMINLDGERFLDEGVDFNTYTYAKYGGEILKERGGIAFEIFDQQTIGNLEPRYSTGVPVVADTFAGLVDGIERRFGKHGFNKAAALATLAQYNEAANDPTPFNPTVLDGKRTTGLGIEKTNWATRLEKPPYVAYAVTGGITFTFGGLRIDTEARVIDLAGRPIRGLFASGENTGGFFYVNYPAGAGLTRGAVFGRIAGNGAASLVEERTAAPAR